MLASTVFGARWHELNRVMKSLDEADEDARRLVAKLAGTSPTKRRGRALRGEEPDEFGAGVDVELAVDACQVELDRLRAEEERGGNVAVRPSLGDLKHDLKLLRGQLLGRGGIASGDRLSARA
jgi:hypothetical protein